MFFPNSENGVDRYDLTVAMNKCDENTNNKLNIVNEKIDGILEELEKQATKMNNMNNDFLVNKYNNDKHKSLFVNHIMSDGNKLIDFKKVNNELLTLQSKSEKNELNIIKLDNEIFYYKIISFFLGISILTIILKPYVY